MKKESIILNKILSATFCLLIIGYCQSVMADNFPKECLSQNSVGHVTFQIPPKYNIRTITPDIAENIATILREKSVNIINFGKVNFEPGAFEIIMKSLSNNPELTGLCFAYANLGFEDANLVADILRTHPKLTHIYFRGNYFGPDGFSIIAEALQEFKNLRQLDFAENDLGPESCAELAKILERNTKLTQIGLGGNDFGKKGAQIVQALQNHTDLTHLDLKKNNLGPDAATMIRDLLCNNRHLRSIALGYNKLGQDDPDGYSMVESLAYNSGLDHLDLEFNNLGPNSISTIAKIMLKNEGLTTIMLSGNNFGPKGVYIVEALLNHNRLSKFNLGGNHLGLRSVYEIVRILRKHPELTHIDLGGNNFGPPGYLIVEALKGFKNLVSLDLSCNMLGSESGTLLPDILAQNSHLAYVVLNKNNFGKGGLNLTKSLENHTGLIQLDLRCNNLPLKTISLLPDVIKANPYLISLLALRNNIDIKTYEQITSALYNRKICSDIQNHSLGLTRDFKGLGDEDVEIDQGDGKNQIESQVQVSAS